jgi:hypothetical protein
VKITISINAAILIQFDEKIEDTTDPVDEVSTQTSLESFKRPQPEPEPEPHRRRLVSSWRYGEQSAPRGARSDFGKLHHCSRCGMQGRRALARLGNRCLHCVNIGEWV